MNPWIRTHKGDDRGRKLADQHYTRQTPGHPMWTRPGYNFVLVIPDGSAVWCWWRPKWEDGRPGTKRKDGLEAIECTIFRRAKECPYLASDLIRWAVEALTWPVALDDLAGEAFPPDGLITGVGSEQTRKGRSARSLPGECYRRAGWTEFPKRGEKADVWLRAHP